MLQNREIEISSAASLLFYATLNFNQVKGGRIFAENPFFPFMAGKDNNLTVVGVWEPQQCSFQTLVIIENKTVIKDQRQAILAFLDKLCGSQAKGQIDLIGRSAADLLQGNQFSAGV